MVWELSEPQKMSDVIDLSDFLPRHPVWLRFARRDESESLAHSFWTPDHRTLQQHRIVRGVDGAPSLEALDETWFTLDDETFAETVQLRSLGGPNLHLAPIRLPRALTVGEWHHPIDGATARVQLAFHGSATVTVGSNVEHLRLISLAAEQDGARRLQLLAEDLGEVAVGAAGTPMERWVVGATDGTRSWFAGVDRRLTELPTPPLPSHSDARPRGDLH